MDHWIVWVTSEDHHIIKRVPKKCALPFQSILLKIAVCTSPAKYPRWTGKGVDNMHVQVHRSFQNNHLGIHYELNSAKHHFSEERNGHVIAVFLTVAGEVYVQWPLHKGISRCMLIFGTQPPSLFVCLYHFAVWHHSTYTMDIDIAPQISCCLTLFNHLRFSLECAA